MGVPQFAQQAHLRSAFATGSAVGAAGEIHDVGIQQHHVGVERVNLCRAGPLGGIHRDIGLLDQSFGAHVRVGRAGDGYPDAGAHQHFLTVDQKWCVERFEHALGDKM